MGSVAFELSSVDGYPTRQSWDASAAEFVATMLDRWHLVPVHPYVGGEAGSVVRVTTAQGEPAVLKVGYPHFEAVWEAVALDVWGPALAPAVLRQDAWTWSLLLERVDPGTPLSRSGLLRAEALDVGAAGAYSRQATSRLPEQVAALRHHGVLELVERGIAELGELAGNSTDHVLLHGDFNPGNILLGPNDTWLTIDPKPMHGDPAFDLWPLIEQVCDAWTRPDPPTVLADDLDRVADLAGCDPARTARWAFARSVLNVSWHLAEGNRDAVNSSVCKVEVWNRIIGS